MRRYKNIPTKKTSTGKNMYCTVRYPNIPISLSDIYVITTIGDRFDTLAQQYYGNSSLWWIISRANTFLSQSSLTPPIGKQIRIPQDIVPIIDNFEIINEDITLTPNGTSPTSGGGSSY